MEPDARQRLLEMPDPVERADVLIAAMSELLLDAAGALAERGNAPLH